MENIISRNFDRNSNSIQYNYIKTIWFPFFDNVRNIFKRGARHRHYSTLSSSATREDKNISLRFVHYYSTKISIII